MLSKLVKINQSRSFATHLSKFATIDAKNTSMADKGMNLVDGKWTTTEKYLPLIDPLTGKDVFSVPDTSLEEAQPFIDSLQSVPRHGLHNPFKNKERYLMLGAVCRKTAEVLHEKETFDFFVDSIMKTVPKSRSQTEGEVRVTRNFFENFGGDQVRFLAEGFKMPGDHLGQFSTGYRFPYGGVGVITPFNFPIEIPVL